MEVKASNVYARILQADTRVKVLEGGSRSSKTWSISQYIIINKCLQRTGMDITIARAKGTWVKATVLKDFLNILKEYNLFNEANYNKTERIYRLNGNEISFIGLDEAQKLHGRKQHIFWINEAVEAGYDSFRQAVIRTTEEVILDYNPSVTSHWIFDKVIPRDDATWIHSTMLDNPFLEPEVRREILIMEPTPENIAAGTADETLWKIYGLGERAQHEGVIFKNVNYVDSFPEPWECKWTVLGLDFGYTNDPTGLLKMALCRGELWLDEMLYEKGLVNIKNPRAPHLISIEQRFEELEVDKRIEIHSESAEPKSVTELQTVGYNLIKTRKGPDSIKNGIDILKRYKINITNRSLNLKKEQENYVWKSKDGEFLNEPVDSFNHLWDPARYIVLKKIGLQSHDYSSYISEY